ncbi:Zinc finger protein MSN2 [Lasiodiplodia hormozganensis]|uniref:Zinc finger protein MSN2 n=1 Tax=Lasiodiplodia hormozganensis TaxID=869390 RepID=A0AA39WZH6_9PEZI|nr:Zinc finger protein MSN2 [Lasiodiplodia hormozganensis]
MATSSLVADDNATTCAICGATFQRVGHLRRHMASLHLGDRPFACSMCDSRFARRDTLQRHLIVHGGVSAGGAEDIKPRRSKQQQQHRRAARACRNCADARQRCDGNMPCSRCGSKARPCSYPPQRQPRAAGRRRVTSPVLLVEPPSAPPSQEQLLSVVDELPPAVDLDCMDLGLDDFSSLDSATFPSCIFDPLAILKELDAEWPGAGVAPPPRRLDDAAAESEAEEPRSPSSDSEPPVISLTEPANDGQALGFGHGASLRQEEELLLPSSPNDDDVWQAEDYGHVPAIPPACYSQIRQCYAQVNGGDGHLLYPTPCLDALPSRAALNAFVQLYFEDFHPVFPLLHRASFDAGTAPWLLVLAVAVTGCRFSRNNVPAARVNAMQELLRRAIQTTMERDRAAVAGEVWLAQAALLNQTGMLHTIDMRLVEHAQTNHALVATLCRRVGCFAESTQEDDDDDEEESWAAWVARESARRLAYCAWLLDSQQVLLFDLLPAIPIDILRVRVPCLEDLWEAPSEDAWRPIRSSASKSPHLALHTPLFLLTLGTADSHSPLRHLRGELTLLYRTRQRRDGLSDFAALMLALAVFRDLQPHLHAPSVNGFPQLPKADNPADLAEQYFEPLLATAQPARTRLQLATLHHIHLLGVLLRVSLRDLFAFSGWRADSGGEAVRRACTRLRRRYNSSPRAAQELRRAVLHAARLFESLRSGSTRAHHEPIALLVAVLTVWLYSVLDDNVPPGSAGAADEDEAEDDCRRRTLLLGREQNDKGAEDAWVAAGAAAESGISVRLGGVGCIRGGGGGTDRRLIREAVRMLLERRAWNLSEAVAGVLTLQVNMCWDGGLHR